MNHRGCWHATFMNKPTMLLPSWSSAFSCQGNNDQIRLQILTTTSFLPEAVMASVALGEILCNLSYFLFNLGFIQYLYTTLAAKRSIGLCGHVLSYIFCLPSSVPSEEVTKISRWRNGLINEESRTYLMLACLVNRWNLEVDVWFLVLVWPYTDCVTLGMLWFPPS